MNKKIIIIALFLTCFIVGGAASRFFFIKNATVITPHKGEAIDVVYATGTVEPTIMVPIAARTTAHLVALSADEGQQVKKGDILARLEDSDAQAAIADLSAKLSFAENDYRRKQDLYKTKSLSRDVMESAKADFDSLTAQLNKAKAEAGYLTLIAPADGLIIKRDGEVGELIPASQPVFAMSCCAPLRITAEVDEEDIPQIQSGQDVLIQSDAFPDKVFHGKVSAITPKGDPIARSYRVRITFDDTDMPMMIGMTAETNIILKKKSDALLIPVNSINKNNQVQAVDNGTIHNITVTTGIKDAKNIEIISGLSGTEKIVTPYHADWKDGQKINIKNADTP